MSLAVDIFQHLEIGCCSNVAHVGSLSALVLGKHKAHIVGGRVDAERLGKPFLAIMLGGCSDFIARPILVGWSVSFVASPCPEVGMVPTHIFCIDIHRDWVRLETLHLVGAGLHSTHVSIYEQSHLERNVALGQCDCSAISHNIALGCWLGAIESIGNLGIGIGRNGTQSDRRLIVVSSRRQRRPCCLQRCLKEVAPVIALGSKRIAIARLIAVGCFTHSNTQFSIITSCGEHESS